MTKKYINTILISTAYYFEKYLKLAKTPEVDDARLNSCEKTVEGLLEIKQN